MKGLTKKQQTALEVIRESYRKSGHSPTVREIAEALGVSSSCSAQRHLDALERKGYIQRDRYKFRAVRLVDEMNPPDQPVTAEVPLVGTVAAGQPILAAENLEGTLSLPCELLPPGNCFLLRVRGDSMIEAGIHDGDLVVIRQQESAEEGDIVAAMVDEEATIKAFYRHGDAIRLQPRNPAMDPIIAREVTILGKAVLAIKRL